MSKPNLSGGVISRRGVLRPRETNHRLNFKLNGQNGQKASVNGNGHASPAPAAAPTDWIQVAREISAEIRKTAAARERNKQLPIAELKRLRESGLVNLLFPKKWGGQGGTLKEAAHVVLEIAKGDPTIGALLGFHYHTSNVPRLLDYDTDGEKILRRSVENNWLWGNVWQLRDRNFHAEPRKNGGFIVNGTKKWSTGTYLGDVTTVVARRTDRNEFVGAVIPTRRKGLRYHRDWDALGLRQSETETITFQNVEIKPEEVFPQTRPTRPFDTMPLFYTTFTSPLNAAFYLGTTLGAIEAARDFTLTHAKPRIPAFGSARKDPYLMGLYGEFLIKWQAGEAFLDQIIEEVQALWARRETATEEEIDKLTLRTAALANFAVQTALEITPRIYDAAGGGATAALSQFPLDRYWRDVRTLSLHHPLVGASVSAGNYFLNAEFPQMAPMF